MDDLDRKILSLLVQNARMPVKEIAEQVSLTSPAVSSRILKMDCLLYTSDAADEL